jgi:AcrR family transcriptional regulator
MARVPAACSARSRIAFSPYISVWKRYARAIAAVNTALYVSAMTRRLTAADWIDFALTTLARDGYEALKADVLARKLDVSRGSFYWHFADLGAFHARVIERWKQVATEAIIADIERHAAAEQRLEALLHHAFAHGAALELRMRAWADNNAAAARALAEIDGRRRRYIEQLLQRAGIAPAVAAARTQILYWTYLGAALSRSKLAGERLGRIMAELKRIGLGDAAPRRRDRA